jgi:DNA-binding NarL/FixJ family response regulator
MLAALGLAPAEEEVYRRLVARAGSGVGELTEATGRPPEEIRSLLGALVERGLAVATGELYSAAPPAVALGALLRRYRDELYLAERELTALSEEHRMATLRDAAGGVVEVITDIAAVRHRYIQVQEAARHQVRSIVVPNMTVVPPSENAAGFAAMRRGVRYRALVGRDSLSVPGFVAEAIESIGQGEEIRVTDHVPVKLVIADQDRAMLPLASGQYTAPASILVHGSGLLDALIALFEMTWERAYPLWPNAAGDGLVETRPGDLDELDARVLALLLTGLTDQAVAGQLGISLRTVQRRIRVLLDKAGVETRIQLGWYAARHDWA